MAAFSKRTRPPADFFRSRRVSMAGKGRKVRRNEVGVKERALPPHFHLRAVSARAAEKMKMKIEMKRKRSFRRFDPRNGMSRRPPPRRPAALAGSPDVPKHPRRLCNLLGRCRP